MASGDIMIEFKKWYSRTIISFVILVVLVIGIFILNSIIDDNKPLSNYILESNIDYKVNLKDNKGISNEKLFVSKVTDTILAKFNYKYLQEDKVNFKYKYDIIAYVICDIDDDKQDIKEVFRKEKPLVKTDYMQSYNDILNIEKSVELNYDYYNDIASEYNNSVNIAIKSRLLVEMNLYINYENGLEEKYTDSISLPLENSTFSINKNETSKRGIIKSEEKNPKKILLNIIFCFIIIIDIVLLIFEFTKLLNYKKKYALEFKYRKIMRDYDNIVVPINKIPKDENIVTVKVLYFKSMIDIQKELHIPILCYKSDEFIVYMIINNKFAYVYFLNNEQEKI